MILRRARRQNPSNFYCMKPRAPVVFKLRTLPFFFSRLGRRRKKKSSTLSENEEISPTNKRARRSKSFDDDQNVMMLPLQLPGTGLYTL